MSVEQTHTVRLWDVSTLAERRVLREDPHVDYTIPRYPAAWDTRLDAVVVTAINGKAIQRMSTTVQQVEQLATKDLARAVATTVDGRIIFDQGYDLMVVVPNLSEATNVLRLEKPIQWGGLAWHAEAGLAALESSGGIAIYGLLPNRRESN